MEKRFPRAMVLSVFLSFWLLTLAACLSTTSMLPTATVRPSSPPQLNQTETKAASPTPPFPPSATTWHKFRTATPTLRPSITPTPTVPPPTPTLAFVEQRCVQRMDGFPPALNGQMVVFSHKPDEPSYLLNLKTGQKSPLGNTLYEIVSPDGNLLAYADLDIDSIVIRNAAGKTIKTLSDPEEFLTPAYWLDNHWLALNRRRGEWGSPILPSLVLLDPFTGQRQEFLPDYPQLDDFSYSIQHWMIRNRFVINPSLNQVVYPARREGLPLVLWDVRAQKEVAQVYYGANTNGTPWWSPDGTQFVTNAPLKATVDNKTYRNVEDGLPYMGGSDLFLVSQTGEIRRLTYFTTTTRAWQDFYLWSPDGKQIAFLSQLLDTDQSTADVIPRLAVVEVATGKVVDYCIDGYPLWSVDSQYIVLTQRDDKFQYHIFLVDLQTAYAWQIAEDANISGWMVAP